MVQGARPLFAPANAGASFTRTSHKMTELEKLSLFTVVTALEQNEIVPKHIIYSRIEQLPIPLLLKERMKSHYVQWKLQPILIKFTFEFNKTIAVPREVQFHIYGLYGICGLFFDEETKLLLQLEQHDCQEVNVWWYAVSQYTKGDLRQKVCMIFTKFGVPVSLGDLKSQCYGRILMNFNREIVLMRWKGDQDNNWLDDILQWRKSAVRHAGISAAPGKLQTLAVFRSMGSESEVPIEISREFNLLDGIACDDVQSLQTTLNLSDGHIFIKLLHEASDRE